MQYVGFELSIMRQASCQKQTVVQWTTFYKKLFYLIALQLVFIWPIYQDCCFLLVLRLLYRRILLQMTPEPWPKTRSSSPSSKPIARAPKRGTPSIHVSFLSCILLDFALHWSVLWFLSLALYICFNVFRLPTWIYTAIDLNLPFSVLLLKIF